MTAKQLIEQLPGAFKPDAAGELQAVIQLDITEPVHIVIGAGNCEVHEGRHEQPSLTAEVSDADLVALMTGELDGMTAFMTGRLKVHGDIMLAQQLTELFDPSAPKR